MRSSEGQARRGRRRRLLSSAGFGFGNGAALPCRGIGHPPPTPPGCCRRRLTRTSLFQPGASRGGDFLSGESARSPRQPSQTGSPGPACPPPRLGLPRTWSPRKGRLGLRRRVGAASWGLEEPSCDQVGLRRTPPPRRRRRLRRLLHTMSEREAGQHLRRRRQVEFSGLLLSLLCCLFLVCTKEIAALADFSGYLTKLLQNHTVYACDGDRLSLQCPRHSTISVQSAYYGQAYQLCNTQQPEAMMKAPLNCVAPTTLQKVLDECQDLRACQLPVNSWVFGPDLCPGITKYLLVSFKCKPTEYKTRSVCENEELKLHCKESKILNIYSASYGRSVDQKNFCSSEVGLLPQFVPKFIFAALDPVVTKVNPSWKPKEDTNVDLKESRFPKRDGIIVSNSLATLAYIKDHPERAALLFVSSVCIGLVLTLCALVIRVSYTNDFEKLQQMGECLVPENNTVEDDSEEEEEEGGESSSSDLPEGLRGFRRASYSPRCSLDSAELAERIERREQIIQEIWMNSGLDSSPTRSLSPFYINEQQCVYFG